MDGSDARASLFCVLRQLPHRREVRDYRGCRSLRAIRQAEVGTAKTMIDRTEERFGLKPKRLAADSAYGSAPTLAARP